MKLMRTLSAVAGVAILLSGCATAYTKNNPYDTKIAGKVLRMTVGWWEKDDRLYAKPAVYSVAASAWKWGPNANRHRWVTADVNSLWNLGFRGWRYVLVPDQLPMLQHGDLIDVFIVHQDEFNLNELRASVAVKLVCRSGDTACFDRSKKELGGLTELVPGAAPDLSAFTFTPKYDEEGKLLRAVGTH